jgi:hypothetical protein
VKNKDEKRPVMSFQADKELVYKIDSLCAAENDSRNRVLGKIFEKALKDPEENHSSPYKSKKETSGPALGKDSKKEVSDWLWIAAILIGALALGPEIIASVKGTNGSTSETSSILF